MWTWRSFASLRSLRMTADRARVLDDKAQQAYTASVSGVVLVLPVKLRTGRCPLKMMVRCVQIGLLLLLVAAAIILQAAVTIVSAIPSAVIAAALFVWRLKGYQRVRTGE